MIRLLTMPCLSFKYHLYLVAVARVRSDVLIFFTSILRVVSRLTLKYSASDSMWDSLWFTPFLCTSCSSCHAHFSFPSIYYRSLMPESSTRSCLESLCNLSEVFLLLRYNCNLSFQYVMALPAWSSRGGHLYTPLVGGEPAKFSAGCWDYQIP